jgi:ribonuclease HI
VLIPPEGDTLKHAI